MANVLAQLFPLRNAHPNTRDMMAIMRKNSPNIPKNAGALLSDPIRHGCAYPIPDVAHIDQCGNGEETQCQ